MGWNFLKKTAFPMAGCFIGFEEVRNSIVAYSEDHDGKLPNAKTWQDDVREYYRKESARQKKEKGPVQSFKVDGLWGCTLEDGSQTGIAFNSELSGKKVSDIKDKNDKILVFEIEKPSLNANQVYKARKDPPPKIFGSERGWLKIPLRGELSSDGASGSFHFDSGKSDGFPNDGADEKKEAKEEAASDDK